MKMKVNIINTWCILISEAVTVPSLTMMTSTVSEESLARDTHTHTAYTYTPESVHSLDRHTHYVTHLTSSILNFFKAALKTKNPNR